MTLTTILDTAAAVGPEHLFSTLLFLALVHEPTNRNLVRLIDACQRK